MQAKQRLKISISWLVVFIWMIVIFYLSSQTAQASDSFSKTVTGIILRIIGTFKLISIETSTLQNWVDLLNNTVRQYAHGAIFFILALFVCHAFSKSGMQGWKLYTFSFLFCAIYACFDEIHQIFVPGRGAEIEDFLMDCTGALMGLVLYSIINWSMGVRKDKSYI